MPVKDVVLYGSDILKKHVEKVGEDIAGLEDLFRDLEETMHVENGLGLAANQIGVDKAVLAVDLSLIDSSTEEPTLFLLNPVIVSSEGSITEEEGCLSIPDVSIPVTRPEKIRVKALDRHGKPVEIEAVDLFARVLCHEIDHLEGVTIVDRAGSVRRQMLKPVLRKMQKAGIRRKYFSS